MKKASTAPGEDPERFKTAASTMLKYIGNIAGNPDEEKFRWASTLVIELMRGGDNIGGVDEV